MSIDTLIFDFDGVIAEQGFRSALRTLAERAGIDHEPLPRLGMKLLVETGYVVGRGDEQAFWRALQAQLGDIGERERFRAELISASAVRPWMVDLATALRGAGYRTAVLSDHTEWLDEIERRTPFAQGFERVFNSYYLGACKREPLAFERVLEQFGASPGRSLFIDDNPRNVETARSCGLHGIVYRQREPFLADLQAALGVLPAF